MTDLLLTLRSGLPTGVAYALIAYSFTLAYKSCGAFNFAVGQLAILGAIVYISLSSILPVAASVVAALIVLAVLGVLTYFGIVRRPDVRGAEPVTLLILMLGISIVIENGVPAIWGYYALESPALVSGGFRLAGVFITHQQWLMIGVSVVTMGAVYMFERKTMLGKALVASGSDRDAAIVSGVNDRLIQAIAWALAFALTALAGILITPLASARITSAARFSVFGIGAAFVGGLGSGGGALAGGLAMGCLSAVVATYMSTQFSDAILFGLVIAFLLFRPAGFFGNPQQYRGPRA